MQRICVFAALALALLTGAPRAAVAQDPPSRITAADSAAVLLRAAQDFEREGEAEIAAALYGHILERFAQTPAADAARARFADDADRLDPVSRMELPVFGTLYGAWLGLAVPAAFDAGSNEAYGAGFLIGAPLGLFSMRALQRAQGYSEGQARAISWGGVFGTWQGLGWAEVLDLGGGEFCDQFGCYDTGDNDQELIASMIVGGLLGIGTGAFLARKPIRSGVSSAAQGGSIWGTIYGAMIVGLFDPGGDTGLTVSLLSGIGGLAGGALLGDAYDLSRPRVRWMNLGAIAGGLAGLGVDLLAEPDSDEVAILIPLVSSVAGLVIATRATRDMRADPFDGAGRDGGLGTSMLRYGPDGWSLSAPVPMPTMLPVDDVNGRTSWRPALSFEFFRATF